MTLSRQPPAGRPAPRAVLASRSHLSAPPLWSGLRVSLFDSGTSALAVGLRLALASLPAGSPVRVALPAYACPNLVAAVLWAGATPEYYELSRSTLGPAPGVIDAFRGDRHLVVLNVDAFGADTLTDTDTRGLSLVHDLAQSFAPFVEGWQPRARFTITSFGRAKPLSLTLGGALLVQGQEEMPSTFATLEISAWKLAVRAAIYGLSLRSGVFGVLSRIPALGIGRTRFTPLNDVACLPARWHAMLAAAVAEVRRLLAGYQAQSLAMLRVARDCGATVPSTVSMAAERAPLWRIPVLCPTPESAARLAYEGVHLGISRLYAQPLPQIVGMPAREVAERWPEATWIAERLITLPTHGRLHEPMLEQLRRLLELRLH